jgi:D-tyrosyl-tRNA(Tyr) deacylase
MRAVIQRVSEANVVISGAVKSSIQQGVLILLGIDESDGIEDITWLAGKISRLRIFDDDNGVMNVDIRQAKGKALVVSQFTLYASTKKGNRPSYIRAARPETAIPLYEKFVSILTTELGQEVMTGEFGAKMQVQLVNDGPVTIIIDTKSRE